MRILLIIFDLFFTTFFCFGMDTNYQYMQDAWNTYQIQTPPEVFQRLSEAQKTSLKGIECSIALYKVLYNVLSPKINSSIPASEYAKIDAPLDTSLDILALFLDYAHWNGLRLAINPMRFLHNKISYDVLPISTALDFLHVPLLLACKKHFPDSLANSTCLVNEKSVDALTKYKHQESRIFNICLSVSQKNKEILSYYLSQYAKLPTILSILLS